MAATPKGIWDASTNTPFLQNGVGASGANITIDAGAVNSNKIVGATSAQTYVISTDGGSIIIQKVTATKWKIIAKF